MYGKNLLSLTVIFSLIFLVSLSTAAEKQKPSKAKAPVKQTSISQMSPKAPPPNGITQAARKTGFNKARIKNITVLEPDNTVKTFIMPATLDVLQLKRNLFGDIYILSVMKH